MELDELLELLCQGKITSEQMKEEVMKGGPYSNQDIAKLMEVIGQYKKETDAKINEIYGILNPVIESTAQGTSESKKSLELRMHESFNRYMKKDTLPNSSENAKSKAPQTDRYVNGIKVPTDHADFSKLMAKTKALISLDQLNEAGELYIAGDCYWILTNEYASGWLKFWPFCRNYHKKLDSAIIDKSKALLEHITDPAWLLDFYKERAQVYELFGNKSAAENDRREIQKLLDKI